MCPLDRTRTGTREASARAESAVPLPWMWNASPAMPTAERHACQNRRRNTVHNGVAVTSYGCSFRYGSGNGSRRGSILSFRRGSGVMAFMRKLGLTESAAPAGD